MARSQTRNHETVDYTVNVKDAITFIRGIDEHMAANVAHVETYAGEIMDEVRAFSLNRETDSTRHAQTALVFAILSPQCKFAANVRATALMMAQLHNTIDTSVFTFDADGVYGKGTYCVDIVDIITDHGAANFLSAKPASVRLAASMPYLRALTGEDMTLAAMKQARKDGAVVGLGDKTMRMALALYDGGNECYTLDVHMLRGIQLSYGGTVAGTMIVNTAAYDMLEAALVDWHARTFPTMPTFVSQWALWNEWGFGGHQSHLAIFGL